MELVYKGGALEGWVNAWFRASGRTIYKMSLRCNQAVIPHWLRLTSLLVTFWLESSEVSMKTYYYLSFYK